MVSSHGHRSHEAAATTARVMTQARPARCSDSAAATTHARGAADAISRKGTMETVILLVMDSRAATSLAKRPGTRSLVLRVYN
jgi:hypothetical protein